MSRKSVSGKSPRPKRARTNNAPTPRWRPVSGIALRAQIADAMLAAESPTVVGEITLMPHQQHALARVREAIRRFHGALLADEVGLGKTFVALALARDYDSAHVIAPAALIPMWKTAIVRSGSANVRLLSMHQFSHSPRPAPCIRTRRAPVERAIPSDGRNHLVIIDEAHHLRTPHTRRYRAIAQFVASRDLLLLSATPVHNTAKELRHLLALFAGNRADLLHPLQLSQLIVRQQVDALAHSSALPLVREHSALPIPHDRATLNAILSLPDPLPARDGAVAGALIRLGLLRAWCSSDAALGNVLTRRLLRGEALKHALAAGRHPTQAELRSWLVGEHEVQLAFPELVSAHHTESTQLSERLEAHLTAVQQLLDHQRRYRAADNARAAALRGIITAHPNAPILAFSQFTQTVHSLYRALSDIAGVGALSGMHARIASGRIARLDAIARFAPLAQGKPQPPPHQAIRLLITTDLLSEGVNLQDAQVVVHLDLPWTDAIRQQRVGRIARIGSPHHTIHVYTLRPPPPGDRALRLTTRLLKKAALANAFVGATHHRTNLVTRTQSRATPAAAHATHVPRSPDLTRRTSTRSAAELVTQLHRTLRKWRADARESFATVSDSLSPDTAVNVAIVPSLSGSRGWIAAIRVDNHQHVIAHFRGQTGTDPLLLAVAVAGVGRNSNSESTAATARAVDTSGTNAHTLSALRDANRQLHAFLEGKHTSAMLGQKPAQLAHEQRVALQHIATSIAALRPHVRHAFAAALQVAEQLIHSAVSVGAQHALTGWLAAASADHSPTRFADHFQEWLAAWRHWPALVALHESRALKPSDASVDGDAEPPQLLALLLLRPTTATDVAELCSVYDETGPAL